MREYHEDVDENIFSDYVSNLNYSSTQGETDSNIIECYLRELMNNACFLDSAHLQVNPDSLLQDAERTKRPADINEEEEENGSGEDFPSTTASSFVTQSRRLAEKRRSSLTIDFQQRSSNGNISLNNTTGNANSATKSRYKSFSFDHLSSVIQDLFIAGTETMSNTLSWSLLYVASYEQCQRTIGDEIDRVLGREKQPTESDRHKMPYVEAFMNETMRYQCAGPILIPRSTTRDVTFRGYHIPAGSFVMANIWSCMRDSEHWHEPDVFEPRRFLEASGAALKSPAKFPAMMPFGLGKRACVGESIGRLQLFLVFTSILQKFHVSFANERDRDDKKLLAGIPGVGLNAPNVALKFKLR
jgi:cytochrome P450